ncbi:response regulator [Patescibacteria group bacterium]|nr:response regulator [Patescibacteria group bacterium]MBU1727783.1 response regulator [Patescibacteria group bacterium]
MAKTILIVEDDTFLQGLEATKLKKEGYDIQVASDSKEAFKIIDSKTKIDMILLDLLLPDVDGFMILEKIRQEKALLTIPVIVFSNLSEEKDIKRATKLGISEFLVKSNFTLDELAKKVKDLIGA